MLTEVWWRLSQPAASLGLTRVGLFSFLSPRFVRVWLFVLGMGWVSELGLGRFRQYSSDITAGDTISWLQTTYTCGESNRALVEKSRHYNHWPTPVVPLETKEMTETRIWHLKYTWCIPPVGIFGMLWICVSLVCWKILSKLWPIVFRGWVNIGMKRY